MHSAGQSKIRIARPMPRRSAQDNAQTDKRFCAATISRAVLTVSARKQRRVNLSMRPSLAGPCGIIGKSNAHPRWWR